MKRLGGVALLTSWRQRLSTTVSGRLGEGIPLGSAARDNVSERAGTTHYRTRSNLDSRQVWLKVEELP